MGGMGQATPANFRAGDWMCNCGAHNYASKEACHKCSTPREAAAGGQMGGQMGGMGGQMGGMPGQMGGMPGQMGGMGGQMGGMPGQMGGMPGQMGGMGGMPQQRW